MKNTQKEKITVHLQPLTQLVTPAGNAAVHPVLLVSTDTKAAVGRDVVPRWSLAQRVKTLCQLLRPRSSRGEQKHHVLNMDE